jgi:hypothetical protein
VHNRISLILLIFCLVAVSCESSKDYITLRSVDDKQCVKLDAEQPRIFPNTSIDTILLHSKIRNYDFYSEDFPAVIESTSDSDFFVMKIDNVDYSRESEPFLSLFCEFYKGQISRLYFFEVGQGTFYWQLDEASISIREDNNDKILVLNATLKSMGFAISDYIRFPYNDQGDYDYDVVRYIKVECVSRLNEDALRYF